MLTKEQLAARKIGGSDVSTILGLNQYKTALELYAEIKGEIPLQDFSDNEAVEAGEMLEAGIANLTERRMTRRLGRDIKLRRCNLTLSNPKYPWLTCHIDRDVVGEDRGVEIKNVGWRMGKFWGEEDTDEIPEYYLPQPHTYMIVKEYPVWTTAGYFGGADLRLYEITADQVMKDIIVEETHKFWHEHVLKGVPPKFDPGHAAAERALKRLYPGTNGATIAADPALEHWRGVMQEADELAKQYEKSADLAKRHMLSAMGEAAILTFGDGATFTRKKITRKAYSVDAAEYVDGRFKKPLKE